MASGRGVVVGREQGRGIEEQVERGGKRGRVCGGVCVKRVVESERVVMEGLSLIHISEPTRPY